MKKIRLALIGHIFNITCIQELLRNEHIDVTLLPIENWNALNSDQKRQFMKQHNIVHFLIGRRDVKIFLWAKLYGVKTINHYIGTDVQWLLRAKRSRKFRAFLCSLIADHTLCVSPNLKDELSSLHIRSRILPIYIRHAPEAVPEIPGKLAAYAYIPQHRMEFYGWQMIEQLIRDFPDIHFFIVAHDGADIPHYANVEFLGWQEDMAPWIKASYIYVRMTEHDGLPRMMLEALAYGRHVIYSQKFPYCRYASNYEELKLQFGKLLKSPALNYEGADYVRTHFNPEIIKQNFINLYNS